MRYVIFCLFCLLPNVVFAEKRASLIIGNDNYSEVPVLAKAVADAEAMAEKLDQVGFETILAIDVNRREMNRAIARFTNMLEPGDTALVFYAGHGVEISGENYLLPTDIIAPADGETDLVVSESIALSELLDRVRATGARTTIAIIDACRNNPFKTVTGRNIGQSRGLARIAAPEGTFVMYSAGAGQLALDGLNETDTNKNSVFTRLLLPKLDRPGLELRSLISELRVEVRDLAKTQNHAQFPAYYDELLGDFYFKTTRGLEPVNVAVADTAPAPQSNIRADFSIARDVGSPLALEAFLDAYGDRDDFTVDLARKMLENMRGDAKPGNDRSTQPEGSQVAAAPKTENTQVAALPKPEETPAAPDRDRKTIIRESQLQLRRLGCDPGGADGVLGPRSRAAFERFATQTGSSMSQNSLGTQQTLDVLKSTAAPACNAAVVATAPATEPTRAAAPAPTGLDISGTWSYSFFCIIVPGSGNVVYRPTGANTFKGNFRDSLGQTGTISLTLSGRNYSARIVTRDGVVANESGTFSSNGRSFKASAHSAGCSVNGNKVG